MKSNITIILALLVLSLVPAATFAGSITLNSTQSSFLSQYVPIGVLANATFYNQSIGSNHYIVMKVGGQYKYLVANFTGKQPAIIFNTSQVVPVLGPFLTASYYPSNSTITSLKSLMQTFVKSAQGELNDCVTETGLTNPAGGCTFANSCASCRTVPACNYVLGQAGGPTYPFGVGIMNFSYNYTTLNNSYNTYFKALNSINSSNINFKIDTLQSSLWTAIGTSSALGKNPIFPLPANFSLSLLQKCSYTSTPTSQPWYCVVANGGSGFCESLTFNYTAANKLNSTVNSLEALPISGYDVFAESQNSSTLAHSYLSVFATTQQNATFTAFLKGITPKYNAAVSNTISLINRTSNASLNIYLRTLESTYASIKGSGASLNISYANKTFIAAMANNTNIYNKISALYTPVYNLAQNNTAKITAEQLNFRSVPASLVALAAKQQQINIKLNGIVNATQLPAMLAQLQGISSQLSISGPVFDMPSIVKSIDGGIVSSMLAGSTATIPENDATAPLYAAIISLIIGIILIAIFYMLTYFRLKRRQKIHMHHRVKRAWTTLFIALVILLAIYTYATYAYASAANQFLPISGFINSFHGAKAVYITYNTSAAQTTATAACAQALKSQFAALNKTTTTITVTGVSCLSSSNSTIAGTDCYNKVLSSMSTIIQIEPTQNSSILYSGMYGTVLHVSGSVASGSSCPIASIFATK